MAAGSDAAPAAEATLPVTSETAPVSTLPVPTTTVAIGASTFVVRVAGRRRPGCLRPACAARVVDAIDATGGPSPQAELDSLNLAAPLVDSICDAGRRRDRSTHRRRACVADEVVDRSI